MKYTSFSGNWTRLYLTADGMGKAGFEYDAAVSTGQFKVLLVSPDDTIIPVFEGTDNGSKAIEIPSGKNRLILVGDEATGQFQFTLNVSENVTVEPAREFGTSLINPFN